MSDLSWRIKRLMQHSCDIYRPKALAGLMGAVGASDPSFEAAPLYKGVISYYQPTPNFDMVGPQGLTTEVNILTSDIWWFLQDQPMGAGWLIVMKTVGHPFYGNAWVTQGQPTDNASMPGRPTNSLRVYARSAPTSIIPIGP